ncbi:oligosaccharide flippase family protein [Bacteroides propionicifaciens]|uniref:oligosaccharide flippase family protein n=1 Tax=Bacteroides propionicifaciens TaxID=392838 RepID=UPI000368DF9D|nr:oligosaccharide flippase family protein [Bacteroides propionicifaciens]
MEDCRKCRLQNGFLKHVITLASGTACSQILSILFLPILSRIYNQDAFGILASFTAIVSLISSVSTLKYDTALVFPKNDKVAYVLLKLANITTIGVLLISFIVISIFKNSLDINVPGIEYLILLGVLLSVNYNNSTLWNIRFKDFKNSTISRIIQVISVFLFQVILYSFLGVYGLVIGNLCGVLLSGAYLIKKRKFDFYLYKQISLADMKKIALKYKDFPLFMAPSELILSFASNLPTIMFLKYASLADIGIYGMATRILMQPISLISSSVKNVTMSYMSDRKNTNSSILFWYFKIVLCLLGISIFGCIFIFFLGDFIIDFFLGNNWLETYTYMIYLMPLFISMMISSPASVAVRVFDMQRLTLVFSIFSLIVKWLVLIYTFSINLDIKDVIFYYAIVSLILVILNHLLVVIKIIGYEKNII